MRRVCAALAFAAVVGLASAAQAQNQVSGVNIVYPIHGGTYPITDPGPGKLESAYTAASFSVTCGGGPHRVEWGFDGSANLGRAIFYDEVSVQFVHKLPGGAHLFGAYADCGKTPRGEVEFRIGQ
jgi:hypothetical protein